MIVTSHEYNKLHDGRSAAVLQLKQMAKNCHDWQQYIILYNAATQIMVCNDKLQHFRQSSKH